jgi:hypothetical protein
MGYKDSMNLYQAFNMNGWGFVDPWGEFRIVLKNAEPQLPGYENNWEINLLTNFKIEFTSPLKEVLEKAKFLGKVAASIFLEKKFESLKWFLKFEDIKDIKNFIEHTFGDIYKQDATFVNPLEFSKRFNKKNLSKFLKYKIIEIMTDTELEKIFNEYCQKIGKKNKEWLNTEETINFLKIAKRKLREIFKRDYPEMNANVFYPWESLLPIAFNIGIKGKKHDFTHARWNIQAEVRPIHEIDVEIAKRNWLNKIINLWRNKK